MLVSALLALYLVFPVMQQGHAKTMDALNNAGAPIRLLAFGNSLVAGWGVGPEEAFPVVLEQSLRDKGWNVEVTNAGVSGDTTAGGLNRLPWLLQDDWDAAILELGANDVLRGEDPAVVEANLRAMLELFRQKGIPVLLAGMRSLANYGPNYAAAFDKLYPQLAEEYDAVFYPFFLENVAQVPELNQPDGLHPNGAGVRVIVEGITPKAVELLERATR